MKKITANILCLMLSLSLSLELSHAETLSRLKNIDSSKSINEFPILSRSNTLQCGDIVAYVESFCDKNSDIRRCIKSNLFITNNDNKKKSIALPYLPDSQKKLLKNDPYIVDGIKTKGKLDFTGIMQYGQWSPDKLTCINLPEISRPLLKMHYNLDNDTEFNEQIKGSLSGHPVLIDQDGNFITWSLAEKAKNMPQQFKNKGKGNENSVNVNGVWNYSGQ